MVEVLIDNPWENIYFGPLEVEKESAEHILEGREEKKKNFQMGKGVRIQPHHESFGKYGCIRKSHIH